MKTDFGEFRCIVTAEEIDEVVLVKAEVEGVFLGETPLAIAATIFPIRDVLLIDANAHLVEGGDDSVLRDVLEEHAVDDVADGFGEARDLAVTRFTGGRRMSGLN